VGGVQFPGFIFLFRKFKNNVTLYQDRIIFRRNQILIRDSIRKGEFFMVFSWLLKSLKTIDQQSLPQLKQSEKKIPIQKDIRATISQLKCKLGYSPDLIVRTFQVQNSPTNQIATIYMQGLVDEDKVNHFITHSLCITPGELNSSSLIYSKNCFEDIKTKALTVGNVQIENDWNNMLHQLLSGDIIILVNGFTNCIIGNLRGGERRPVSEPQVETNIRGPKDSFTESIGTNIALIRRKIKNPNLWMESICIGDISKTDVTIMYVKGIAEEQLIEKTRKSIRNIKVNFILDSGYVEELIQKQAYTPFPTIFNSERPDVIAGNLLEGRIAVFVDGTPNTLILPTTFSQFFKAAEDYYQKFDFSVFMRVIRYLSFFIVILMPAIYIALTTYHQEMIPTPLVITLLAQREDTPFPAVVEALLMEFIFEIIREAGIRMPRAIGQAVSIVGAIVIGQAAVQAGIVTAMMVIIVSITGIASFALPSYSLSISARLIRFPIMGAAAILGIYGVIMSIIILVAHMNSLKSFGVPYLSPFAPFHFKQQKDTIWRAPFESEKSYPIGNDREDD